MDVLLLDNRCHRVNLVETNFVQLILAQQLLRAVSKCTLTQLRPAYTYLRFAVVN